jgi:hypothetical protein
MNVDVRIETLRRVANAPKQCGQNKQWDQPNYTKSTDKSKKYLGKQLQDDSIL